MLSAVLPHYENVTIGQHPHIIRLLKGVFNSRPPKVKLLSEWDLDKPSLNRSDKKSAT
jgi:hypothetical protein